MKLPGTAVNDAITRLSGVQRRLTFAFGVLILTLMLTVLLACGLYLKGVMEREEHGLSTLLTRVLAVSVSRVSFSGRYHAQLLLEDIQQNQPNIRYLLISNRDGQVLASSIPQWNDTHLKGAALTLAQQALQSGAQTRHLHLEEEPILEVTLPYRGGFDHTVQGVVQVGISQRTRNAALQQGMVFMSVLVLALLIAGMSTVRWLSLYFGNPVRQLADDMAATLQAIPDPLLELDAEGRYWQVLAASDGVLMGTHKDLAGRFVHDTLPPEVIRVIHQALQEAADAGKSLGRQFNLDVSGERYWFELSVARKNTQNGIRFIVLLRNISARKQAEERLYLYANVFRYSTQAILITNADNCIIAVNPALTELTGYNDVELLGKNPSILAAGHTPPEVYQQMWAALKSVGYWQGELNDRHKNGQSYPKWVNISAIRGENGQIINYIASFTDITERKAVEARINHLAYHDALTGLYNRLSLEERLEQAISDARREGFKLAVIFIDLDRFKLINDTLGHHAGDLLLIEVAKRLKQSLREADLVARLGGDEFVVVLSGIHALGEVVNLAEQIAHRLNEAYFVDEYELRSSPSVGISLFPSDGDNLETLMRCADTAMYHAKEQGRNNYQFYTEEMNIAARERMELERDLRVGLEQNQFELYYQPKVETVDGRVSGVEALVRWHHPTRGMVPPDKFIPIAEEAGLITVLGEWVLDTACRQRAAWREQGINTLLMSVNLSAKQLNDPELIPRLQIILARYHIQDGELELEVTETAAMANAEQAIVALKAIRELGVALAIDDFGTGYSSLAYLKSFPIQTLKLDRTFVRDIEIDENDAAICVATISLAHNLGLKVVAEGVENQAQRDFLCTHHYDTLQGYFFSRPLPATEVWRFFAH